MVVAARVEVVRALVAAAAMVAVVRTALVAAELTFHTKAAAASSVPVLACHMLAAVADHMSAVASFLRNPDLAVVDP